MDAREIFKSLTCGVKFTKKTTLNEKRKIKTEIEDGTATHEKKPKRVKEENLEDEVDFKLLSGADNLQSSKKKKKQLSPEEKAKLQEEERVSLLRKKNKISVSGKNVPVPIEFFDELCSKYDVEEKVIENLAACSYRIPTPIQMQAIPIMMCGRNLLACAPTGSGKTVAFLMPVIRDLKSPQRKGFRALILCPTRELAQQTYQECVRLTDKTGLKIHIISKVEAADVSFGVKSKQKCDILISTPNRVRFLIQQTPPALELNSIEWLVIDEADRLLEDGKDNFKEQFDDILQMCTNPLKKFALFSATLTVPIAKWAIKNLKNLVRVTIGQQNTATDQVDQELLFVGSESGKLLAFRELIRTGLKPPVLVFVQSKDRAKQLFNELVYDGINVEAIHADRTQQQRDNVVKGFREGRIWVLICTELMSRGIDFKGVNLVVNYDFPPSEISYIHRIGRTGRAGRRGKAITYFTQNDTTLLRNIAHIIKKCGGVVPDFMLTLKKAKKSDRKMLANKAPKREEISTAVKPEKQDPGQFVKAPTKNKRKRKNVKKA